MNEIIVAFLSITGSFAVAYFTTRANKRKMDAEITQIYARLGLDKDKSKAENANTWMDVARKAVDEYSRAMDENVSLRERIKALEERIDVLEEEKRK
jgi:hypothetical protein